jgi:hypothetical protein
VNQLSWVKGKFKWSLWEVFECRFWKLQGSGEHQSLKAAIVGVVESCWNSSCMQKKLVRPIKRETFV